MQFAIMFIIIFSFIFTVCLQNVGAECPAIITKKNWDGEKPTHMEYLILPLDLVVIQHTVTQTCSNDQSCLNTVKDIQRIHKHEAYLWDIGPSFLIADTGKIYEGRGWQHVAMHTYGYNNHSIGIAFIGNFMNQAPSEKALNSARALIECGVELDRLTANHQVVLQSQLVPTQSPGNKLATKIKLWPDWKEDVVEIQKQVDKQELNNSPNKQQTEIELTEFRAAGITEILNTPKEIDLLSNERDIITELIQNLYKLARQILDTVNTLTKAVRRKLLLFLEKLTSDLRTQKDRIDAAISGISLVPAIEQCITNVRNRANAFYDDTELKVMDCGTRRISVVTNMIKDLQNVSVNVIKFSNLTVEETKNCTELNYGIRTPTKECLNSITVKIQTATRTFESQRTLALSSITNALNALPAALQLCASNPIFKAGIQTAHMVWDLASCKPFFSSWKPF